MSAYPVGASSPTTAVRREAALVPTHARKSNTRNAQCTHITMTRLFSEDFRCALCLQPGSMGWLYRCTQDKELEMDADILSGNLPNLDSFARNFPLSETPRKGTPMARTTNSDFLREVITEPNGNYTKEQVDVILAQREKVVNIIKDLGFGLSEEDLYLEVPEDGDSPFPRFTELQVNERTQRVRRAKSFCPAIDCQFKCCHHCRPNSNERSFLNLNGIVKGDIPPTSVSGFGFHLLGERPVALACVVRSIGLHSTTITSKSKSRLDRNDISQFRNEHTTAMKKEPINTPPKTPVKPSPFNDSQDADTTFGQPATNAYDSTAMTRRVNKEPKPPSPPPKIPLPENPPAYYSPRSTPGARYSPFTPKNTPTTPSRGPGLGITQEGSPADRSGRSTHSDNLHAPRSKFNIELDREDSDVGLSYTLDKMLPRAPTSLDSSEVTAIPYRSPSRLSRLSDSVNLNENIISADSIEEPDARLSEMEREESEMGFGDKPLELKDGVALTEEAVGLHVPDVITQF